jgi:site-specific DNA-methyltransferase (adenine-specific)
VNTIYFGDNLDIMRKYIKDESVDLVYLDPPFNSKRPYNVIYKDTKSQVKAFVDTWHWTEETNKTYEDIIRHSKNQHVVDAIQSLYSMLRHNDDDTIAYLVMMTPRLLELHRVLKSTGSIYLHCDPTASHYLKIIMDNIFGIKNFQNEIIWHYKSGGASPRRFAKKHDVLLFYSKGPDYNFYVDRIREPYAKSTLERLKHKGARSEVDNPLTLEGRIPRDVWVINHLEGNSKEYCGYQTQKPLALLERIIKASSNPSDVVLDPFCGCATTMIAAEELGRKWIGIDISDRAIEISKKRLNDLVNK